MSISRSHASAIWPGNVHRADDWEELPLPEIEHARYYWLPPAGSHLTRRLLGSLVRRIGALAVATG